MKNAESESNDCLPNCDCKIKNERIYLLRAEVAARLKVDKKTLANWATQRKGPPISRLGGRLVRYELNALLAWESGEKAASEDEKPSDDCAERILR